MSEKGKYSFRTRHGHTVRLRDLAKAGMIRLGFRTKKNSSELVKSISKGRVKINLNSKPCLSIKLR